MFATAILNDEGFFATNTSTMEKNPFPNEQINQKNSRVNEYEKSNHTHTNTVKQKSSNEFCLALWSHRGICFLSFTLTSIIGSKWFPFMNQVFVPWMNTKNVLQITFAIAFVMCCAVLCCALLVFFSLSWILQQQTTHSMCYCFTCRPNTILKSITF